ncbi:GATOR complex protein MIOS-like, partial [Diaphorina citri]|uniref:GATOR complex protein MIOS-like n=1 Tax=Diaphorina citri TaxID=121845 RepID=A0A3Q0JGV8_DIACI
MIPPLLRFPPSNLLKEKIKINPLKTQFINLTLARSNSFSAVQISTSTYAHLLATNSYHHYVKCVDIYPHVEPADMLLALGQANGKVVLTTFGPSAYDALGLTGLELNQTCTQEDLWTCSVQIREQYKSHASGSNRHKWFGSSKVHREEYIAEYLFKEKYQHLERVHEYLIAASKMFPGMTYSSVLTALAWVRYSSRTILVGSSNKYLKLLDLRVSETPKGVQSVNTKAVFGVAVAPFNDHHVASFVDNTIAIWDMRSFDKPVLALAQKKHIIKIHWCPTRHNLLGSLQRDSSAIHLHDVQQSMDEGEATVLERSVRPGPSNQLTSFSWHPKDESRLLTISIAGLLTDYCVVERMTLNWSPSFNIVWTHGRKTLKTISARDKLYQDIDDISLKMFNRAKLYYGLVPDLGQNGNLADDDNLKAVWRMLSYCRKLVDDQVIPNIADLKHPGIRTVFGLDRNTYMSKSECVKTQWTDVKAAVKVYTSLERDVALHLCGWKLDKENPLESVLEKLESGLDRNTYMSKSECVKTQWTDVKAAVKVYTSLERDVALHLCGWKLDKENPLESVLEKLEVEEEYARGAALATFYLHLTRAIQLLNRGAGSNPRLSIVAMALAGYSAQNSGLWRSACMESKQQLTDPYLMAIFAFLTADGDNYDSILVSELYVAMALAGYSAQNSGLWRSACMESKQQLTDQYLMAIFAFLTADGDNYDSILVSELYYPYLMAIFAFLTADGDNYDSIL